MELAAEFDISLSTFIQGVQGGVIVAIAFGSLVCNALAVKYGKRPVYLATTLGLMVTCFWSAAAKSFGSLVAARAIQGFCMGPLEALVPASIADVWVNLLNPVSGTSTHNRDSSYMKEASDLLSLTWVYSEASIWQHQSVMNPSSAGST